VQPTITAQDIEQFKSIIEERLGKSGLYPNQNFGWGQIKPDGIEREKAGGEIVIYSPEYIQKTLGESLVKEV